MGAIYLPSSKNCELRQAEFLSDVVRYDFRPDSNEAHPQALTYCVVVSQDCDLLQDYNRRREEEGAGNLDHILMYEGQLADQVKAGAGGRDIWKPITQNKNERFQLFEAVSEADDAEGTGIPSLVVDFRSAFSMPTIEVYRQIEVGTAKRRCRLADLYREQLQSRAAYFFARIMVPEPHKYSGAPKLIGHQ
jgi:hypothetical protein